MSEERALPHDLDIERALLGALMLSPKAIPDVASSIESADFYSPGHGHLFVALGKLNEEGWPADERILFSRLRSHDHASEWGGAAGLGAMLDGTAKVANVEHYARIILEHSRKREILRSCEELSTQARNGEGSADLALMLRVYAERMGRMLSTSGAEPLRALDPAVDPGPIPWLVEGWMARPEVLLFGGEWYSGKSWVCLELAIALAVGGKWMGSLSCTRACRVLYVDEENPPNVALRRLRQVLTAREVPFAGVPALRYLSQNGIVLTQAQGAAALEREIQAHRPDVLFLDSLSSVRAGEENSASELQAFVRDYLQPLVNRHSLTVALLDNMGKQTKEPRSAGDRIRGTSAKADKGSTIWTLSGDKHTPDRILSQEKNRWDELASSLTLRWQQSDDKSAAWVSCAEERPTAVDVLTMRLQMAGTSGVSQPDLVEVGVAAGLPARTCRSILQKLHTDGTVKRQKAGQRSVRYWLSGQAPEGSE